MFTLYRSFKESFTCLTRCNTIVKATCNITTNKTNSPWHHIFFFNSILIKKTKNFNYANLLIKPKLYFYHTIMFSTTFTVFLPCYRKLFLCFQYKNSSNHFKNPQPPTMRFDISKPKILYISKIRRKKLSKSNFIATSKFT